MSDRDRIAAVLAEHFPIKVLPVKGVGLNSVCNCGAAVAVSDLQRISDSYAPHRADALIAAGTRMPSELTQEWRADYGYDGHDEYDTREEAARNVEDFNAGLPGDWTDGDQAMVMTRWVTKWETDDD